MGFLVPLLCPVPSSAEITLYVTPDGDKAFFIEGDNINDKESVEITVAYDSTILANPRVSLEGGTVTNIFNPNPGILTFNANRGDNPTHSFEAHLSFDKRGGSQGGIFSVTGKVMEPDGTISPSSTTLNLSTPSLLTASSNDGGAASTPEESPATEETASSGNRADILMKAEKSVLQRFREFRGKRGLKAFVALFKRNPRDVLVQEPPEVLSDGKTPVSIRFELQQKGGDSPNIALSDAKLVHLGKEGEKGWVITALPNRGTWNASLLIKTDGKIIEFPLVVAPPVKIDKGITEQNFVAELDRFIAAQVDSGKGENDPLRYIKYEYIFTVNYLASSGNHSAKMTSQKASLASSSK